ncbi:hypothetical protein VTK73DRAFT_9512 [Phialemonium thermophilum]|uniref:Uncharacterized protein n=1 Tax=Phialemonium thermophilum TaxID=223376 RepID=A0ABR3Y5C9_9PEZI
MPPCSQMLKHVNLGWIYVLSSLPAFGLVFLLRIRLWTVFILLRLDRNKMHLPKGALLSVLLATGACEAAEQQLAKLNTKNGTATDQVGTGQVDVGSGTASIATEAGSVNVKAAPAAVAPSAAVVGAAEPDSGAAGTLRPLPGFQAQSASLKPLPGLQSANSAGSSAVGFTVLAPPSGAATASPPPAVASNTALAPLPGITSSLSRVGALPPAASIAAPVAVSVGSFAIIASSNTAAAVGQATSLASPQSLVPLRSAAAATSGAPVQLQPLPGLESSTTASAGVVIATAPAPQATVSSELGITNSTSLQAPAGGVGVQLISPAATVAITSASLEFTSTASGLQTLDSATGAVNPTGTLAPLPSDNSNASQDENGGAEQTGSLKPLPIASGGQDGGNGGTQETGTLRPLPGTLETTQTSLSPLPSETGSSALSQITGPSSLSTTSTGLTLTETGSATIGTSTSSANSGNSTQSNPGDSKATRMDATAAVFVGMVGLFAMIVL